LYQLEPTTADMNLPWHSKHDIVLGTTAPPFPLPQLRLGRHHQSHHAVVFGKTGSGKSRLLESVFIQALNHRNGGVGLVEPHHDLSFDTLTYLISNGFFKDEGAFDRLTYIDYGNGHYVVRFQSNPRCFCNVLASID